MASVNKVILVGNLGADPEVRYTPSGKAVASFSLATKEQWTGKDGEKTDYTKPISLISATLLSVLSLLLIAQQLK